MALTAVTVGVPVMVHVPLVRLMPVGKEGEMAQVAPLSNPVLESQVLVPETRLGVVWSELENALPNCP